LNALVVKKQDQKNLVQLFDTISVCLSKDLVPIGSVLPIIHYSSLKNTKNFREVCAKWDIYAAGIYALDNNVERLAEDHRERKNIMFLQRLLGFFG
jgi:threonine aldolase